MRRRLLNLLTALSLLLCVAVVALWVRSGPMMRLDSVGRGWESCDFSAISAGRRLCVMVGYWKGRSQTYPWEWRSEGQTRGFEPAYPPARTLLGLGWRTRYWPRRDPPLVTMTNIAVVIPYWQIALIGAALPTGRMVSWARRRRYAPGRCPACGYDLRATPDRCPECGASPVQAPVQ